MVAAGVLVLLGAMLAAPAGSDSVIASVGARPSHLGRYSAEVIEPAPATIGVNAWTVHLTHRRDGRRLAHAGVTASVWNPESGERVIRVPVARYVGGGNYRLDGIEFPHVGWWNVALVIDGRGGVDSVAFNVMLPGARATSPVSLPVVAVVGDSAGVEITDFLVPRAVLAASGAARVISVAASSAQFHLQPGPLSVRPEMTFAAFDSSFVLGATYVIVPALVDRESPAVAKWLRAQSSRGAIIVSICDGAWTVANAGLFDGRRATGHWHSLPDLARRYAGTTWEWNSRYVTDEKVISTTGVSASLPASLYLVERLAGREAALAVASEIGIASWDTTHRSGDYSLSRWQYTKAFANHFAWWRHDRIAVPIHDGIDEIALAMTVDAIPRTMRGEPTIRLQTGTSFLGAQGLRFYVAAASVSRGDEKKVLHIPQAPHLAASAIDSAIVQLGKWYGASAAELIGIGMEYKPRVQTGGQ